MGKKQASIEQMRPEQIAAMELCRSSIIVDLHVDVILQKRLFGYNPLKRHRAGIRRQPLFWHIDIPRMMEAQYTCAALGVHYWPWESPRAWAEVRRQFEVMESFLAVPEVCLAKSAKDIEEAHLSGRLAVCAGIEGAHMLNGSLEKLEEAAERGCLYLTLTHFSKNAAATPGLGRGRDETSGLTPFGRSLVKRLNDLGILVDVAHVNGPGVLEACAVSTAPVLATHSCAKALYDTPRGLTDEGIKAIAETGGVIGVIFAPYFLCGRLDASVDVLLDHVFYLADKVGWEHVAFGSDFDGWIATIPNDMRDCRDIIWLVERMLARGAGEEAVKGMLGENLLRVLRKVRPDYSSDSP
ncbi:MAG: dipeptidase [Myxococcales bacterium]|nr:dipeptidase [Myxococcales bacterium]